MSAPITVLECALVAATEKSLRTHILKEKKMKTARILPIVLLLLVPSVSFAQSRATNAAATRSWQSFWRQFSAAINKKDRAALRRMMPSDFFSGGGGQTASEWIKFMDRQNLWREHQMSVALGTKSYKMDRNPGRVTKNDHLIFEYKGGRWWWWGIMGD